MLIKLCVALIVFGKTKWLQQSNILSRVSPIFHSSSYKIYKCTVYDCLIRMCNSKKNSVLPWTVMLCWLIMKILRKKMQFSYKN